VFLCIVHVWFWFFTLLPRFVLLVIKVHFGSLFKVNLKTANDKNKLIAIINLSL
jgi:hypothetical protein